MVCVSHFDNQVGSTAPVFSKQKPEYNHIYGKILWNYNRLNEIILLPPRTHWYAASGTLIAPLKP